MCPDREGCEKEYHAPISARIKNVHQNTRHPTGGDKLGMRPLANTFENYVRVQE